MNISGDYPLLTAHIGVLEHLVEGHKIDNLDGTCMGGGYGNSVGIENGTQIRRRYLPR